LKQSFEDPPAPLFEEVRELILRKCLPERRQEMEETLCEAALW
jgi:hypothetical protein